MSDQSGKKARTRGREPSDQRASAPPARPAGEPCASPRRAEHLWAQRAWQWVEQAAATNDVKFQKRYGTLARKLPSYLQVSGLGQTMAFLYSKSKDEGQKQTPERMLCDQLGAYLLEVIGQRSGASSSQDQVMSFLIDLAPDAYRQASREAMAVSEWLKRFAEGKFGKEQDDAD